MPRLKALDNSEVGAKTRETLEGVQKKLGTVPNLMRTMANAPAVLDAYLNFSGALAKGKLPAKLREQIALVVGEANNCEYCLAAHSALGKMAGLSESDVKDSRQARSSDAKTQAALTFARKVVAERGWVSDEDVAGLRDAGFDDGGVAEIVASVALNLFTNYFNHVAQTEVDFPKVEKLACASAGACG